MYVSSGCGMMCVWQAEAVKGKRRSLHTGIAVDGTWLFVIVPLNHRDGKGKIELDVSICGAAGDVADTLGVAVDYREKGIEKEFLIFSLVPFVLVRSGVID